MALVIDDLQTNRLYRKSVYLPTDIKNKKKNSVIFLMTPNYMSSIRAMNYPFFINNNRYQSYYTEKDISFVLTENHRLVENSDEINILESGLLRCNKVVCTTTGEFDYYGIPYDNVSDVLYAYAFTDDSDSMIGYAVLQCANQRIYRLYAVSEQLKHDIVEFLLVTCLILTARIWSNEDKELYSSYGFENSANNDYIMELKESVQEAVSLNKIDLEIAVWKTQIKITQTILKNFSNENWMSHMYKNLKRKILRIPLQGYTVMIDDTVEKWENILKDQKATLDFYVSVKAIEGKDYFDMSDVVDEYVDWVSKLNCPKALKLKIINTVIGSYKDTIKECEYNLDRYRKLDDASKRIENVKALVPKIFSTWGFLTTGPLSILKSMIMKSILPKSQKKDVLSEAELKAKIELYSKIVESLEDQKKEIQSLDESSILNEQILNNYKRISMNSSLISKYKSTNKFLSHFRTEKDGNYVGYIWLDGENVVAACSVDKDRHYIQAIEITKDYKGKGLSYEILDTCVKLGAKELSVNKNNTIAKHVYDKYGFKTITSTDSMYMMKLSESSTIDNKYYYVSNSREMDDEALFYSENGMGIYDTIENAITAYPNKSYKLYVFDTDMAIKTEILSNGKVKYNGAASLNLIGGINVTYNRDSSVRSYDWDFIVKDGMFVKADSLVEAKLSTDRLNKMNASDFGLPKDRKYPMPDRPHVLAAIKMFNYVNKENEAELAHNILIKIKEFKMQGAINVGPTNKFTPYWLEYYKKYMKHLNPDTPIPRTKSNIVEDYVTPYIKEDAVLTSLGLQTENSITFLEANNQVLVEADAAYNNILRRILYSERIKTHKEVMLLYDQLKEDCPWIRYTFINYEKYMNRNLFIDWSYYTTAFFKNNITKYDKAVNLYFDFLNRFLEDSRLTKLGYNKKTVFVPINDWVKDARGRFWDYKVNLNPISIIYRLANTNLARLKETWGSYKFVFTGTNGYFILDFSTFTTNDIALFIQNVKTILKKEPIVDTDTPDNSTKGIINSVIDSIENNSNGGIEINNLTGSEKVTKKELKDRIDNASISSKEMEKNKSKDPEEKLVDAITTVASKSTNDDEAIQKIDKDDYIKQLVMDLKTSSNDAVSLNPTRVARVRKNTDNFTKKIISGKTVGELLRNVNDEPLPETKLPIDSINDDWQHLTYINHNKLYNLDADIVRCINHFANTTIPVSVIDTNVEDASTSEDWVYTWTIKCEDVYGKRFTLKFDIPKLENNRTMKLRGNNKIINGQLMNLPILKTEESVCQMTSNYNKIFFSGYGTSTGKSYVVADRIIKTLTKMESSKDLTIELGDNGRICSKYDLPADYIDIASVVSKLSFIGADKQSRITLFFNQDELIEKYGSYIKNKDELAYGVLESAGGKDPIIIYYTADYPVSYDIYSWLSQVPKFEEIYNTTGISVRYTYSKASILNTDIPIAVMIGYYIGLIPMLDKADITYQVSDKRPKYDKNRQDLIKLSDAYIVYDLNYDSSMLLNGLKECDMPAHSLTEVNSKKMWIEFLDLFGGRLKADGLDMFYDLMIDPITKISCDKYELPSNFIDGLLYANTLLSDNKFNKHVDITGNRYRTNEIIAGYTYKALCNAYTQYRRDLRAGRDAKMTMKQTAVLDLLFTDNTFGDLSSLSDLLEWESISATSFKGLSGMNAARAYGLDKRTFDKSMVNLLALSTGFSANAGITRQATIDMDIDTARGYIKNSSDDKMSITKTFCMTEAITPFGTTSDDSFRSAMTFIQTSKHGMRTKISDPLIVTNGADQALPFLTSNTFTYKTKNAGKVKEKTDEYMVIEYKNGTTEVVDLRERILKNSDGGMYIAVKLDTDLKEGNIFSSNEIIASDKTSYSNNVGPNNNHVYNIGTFVKFAIINSDEGFEDSCIQTEWIADAMSSVVVTGKEYTLPKDTNIHFIAKKGQKVQEGDPILIFQNSFDEEDANMLVKTLSDESGDDLIAELGRISISSSVTGVVKDIKITRTVEIEELSPSLKKIVNDNEKEIKKFNNVLKKYDSDKVKTADATYKLEPTGKLKNAANSVKIEFRLAYEDKFGVGDKVVCYSALKGVSKGKIPAGKEPYSQYRKNENIHYIQSTNGDMKRMVGSILKVGGLNKIMVELARQSCDIMGIKWKYFDEWDS